MPPCRSRKTRRDRCRASRRGVVVARAPFNGPLRLRVAAGSFHDEHVIGAELAERIYVVLE